MRSLLIAAVVLAATLNFTGDADAGLIGTQVTGSLVYGTNGINHFDPASGDGPLNPSSGLNYYGPTVTIAATTSVPEFLGYSEEIQFNEHFTAVFTDNQLFVQDVTRFGVFDPLVTLTFSDPAFIGLTVVSSGLFTASFSGDTITLTETNGSLGEGGFVNSTFTIASPSVVPEPSSFILLGIAVALGSGCWLCRDRLTH
jgi:hypothetical protein